MKEIKETREVVVGYEASDGERFTDKIECEKYEKTCECVIMAGYKSLVKASINEYVLMETGCDDDVYDIIDLTSQDDIDKVNKALKFYYPAATLINSDEIGTTIMVYRSFSGELTGYHTTIDILLKSIKERYINAIKAAEEGDSK